MEQLSRLKPLETLVLELFCPKFASPGDVLWIEKLKTDAPRRIWNCRQSTVHARSILGQRLFLIHTMEANGHMTEHRRDELLRDFRQPGLQVALVVACRSRYDFRGFGVELVAGTIWWFADEPDHFLAIDSGPLAVLSSRRSKR